MIVLAIIVGTALIATGAVWWWCVGVGAERPASLLIAVGVGVLTAPLFAGSAFARDLGQWESGNPAIREWYQALKQPDVPNASCCGEADAYWCDDYYARGSRAFCKITDDRPDEPRHRPHVDVGTEIEIPINKLKWDRSNPTGHGVVFMSRGGFVFCYVQPGGA